MFVLLIGLHVEPARIEALVATFHTKFLPAISSQKGFGSAQLLRSDNDATSFCLMLSFETQAAQQAWVASDLHQEVWPELEGQCASCSVSTFTSV